MVSFGAVHVLAELAMVSADKQVRDAASSALCTILQSQDGDRQVAVSIQSMEAAMREADKVGNPKGMLSSPMAFAAGMLRFLLAVSTRWPGILLAILYVCFCECLSAVIQAPFRILSCLFCPRTERDSHLRQSLGSNPDIDQVVDKLSGCCWTGSWRAALRLGFRLLYSHWSSVHHEICSKMMGALIFVAACMLLPALVDMRRDGPVDWVRAPSFACFTVACALSTFYAYPTSYVVIMGALGVLLFIILIGVGFIGWPL
jgi:hypothetical protein